MQLFCGVVFSFSFRLCHSSCSSLTSNSQMNTLGVHLVGLHHDLAVVLSSVNLLHVGELERAVVLKGPLPVVEWEQSRVLVPLNGVIRITDYTAVNEGITSCNGCDVFQWTDSCAG